MKIDVSRVVLGEILPLRELHRDEMRCQIVHDSLHERGFTHPYLLRIDGEPVGYGTVVGFGEEAKHTVDEFFVLLEHRGAATRLFDAFVQATRATRIQAQTNDRLLTMMLLDFARDFRRDRILFEDGFETSLQLRSGSFRRRTDDDTGRTLAGRRVEETGDWLLDVDGEIVAAGGILCHYNPPYGDLYMTVAENQRRQGYGSFFVQELKRACYAMGKVPTARCEAANLASRATLQRAGMLPCAVILTGVIDRAGAPL